MREPQWRCPGPFPFVSLSLSLSLVVSLLSLAPLLRCLPLLLLLSLSLWSVWLGGARGHTQTHTRQHSDTHTRGVVGQSQLSFCPFAGIVRTLRYLEVGTKEVKGQGGGEGGSSG